MTSERPGLDALDEAYVWLWLPEATEPLVAGRVARAGKRLVFNYGQSYLAADGRIPIYEPELPLRRGAIPPPAGLSLAGCLRDAAPDAWGRRVILNRAYGAGSDRIDVSELDELTYLLMSGSDRAGAMDFQHSPHRYEPREVQGATVDELMGAAEKVEAGIPLTPELDQALLHGTSLGGARPKAMVNDDDKKLIAKFSSSTDTYNVVKAEYVAMRLAHLAGLNVAPVRLVRVAGKDVLLVERFDRVRTTKGWTRKAMVSALTLFGLDEMMARYASYEGLAEIIRHRFGSPRATLHELFGRMVFNVLCGNTDDHARNHAAFWDGEHLTLTPAYDICPQGRTGNEASQAMAIVGDYRMSTLANCIAAASQFQLSREAAVSVIAAQLDLVRDGWGAVCEKAELTPIERNLIGRRMFLNPFIFEGAPQSIHAGSLD